MESEIDYCNHLHDIICYDLQRFVRVIIMSNNLYNSTIVLKGNLRKQRMYLRIYIPSFSMI